MGKNQPRDLSRRAAMRRPGIMTPTDISVVGPMARHAQDLDLRLHALAGPDVLQRTAWGVELPPPRCRRLGAFRVGVWASSPLCPIDTSVSDLFDRAIYAIVRAEATVDDAARPGISDEEHHRLLMLPLRAPDGRGPFVSTDLCNPLSAAGQKTNCRQCQRPWRSGGSAQLVYAVPCRLYW
jgi:Asp-tRNA(Asn)/Glu-tRNA(Gln) amidotransferase A subunit family amidase